MTTREYNDSVRQHSDSLYRFALRYANDSAVAEDAVQECFVTLWEHRDAVEAATVKGWLIRVLYRWLVSEHRHREAERNALRQIATPDEQYSQHTGFELHDAFADALPRLPEQQRILLLLRDLEGYDYAEMAQMTGLSEQQVGVYLFRARKTMRKLMEDYR